MKKIFYVMMSVIVTVAAVMVACEKRNVQDVSIPGVDTSRYSTDVITTKPTTIEGSELVLPSGSRIQVAKDGYSIDVTLPDGYGFLFKDSVANLASMKTLPVKTFGTYTCVCSGKGSACQTFYQEQAGGFGCLHQSCSGSCTGSFVTIKFEQIYGVIRTDNKELTIPKNLPFTPAILTAAAKKMFFEIPEVQEKIAEQYELMYRFVNKPDFRTVDPEKQSLRDYVFVRVQLYGVDFYMLGPAEFSKRTDVFEVYTAKASCKCGDASGACSMGSGGFLGWKVFYCTGACNGCQLTITKSVSPDINLPDYKLPLKPVPADLPRSF